MTQPKRIWTMRDKGSGELEALDLHDNGVVFYVHECPGCVSQFFVDETFIAEKFTSSGRVFDRSKMPSNFVAEPRNDIAPPGSRVKP